MSARCGWLQGSSSLAHGLTCPRPDNIRAHLMCTARTRLCSPETFTCPWRSHVLGICTVIHAPRQPAVGPLTHSEWSTRGGVLQSSYTTRITKISEAVDVYSDWIDACEAENPPEQEDAEQ